MMNRCFIFLFLFTSCGYQWGTGRPQYSVSIPYIVNDDQGELTRALIYAASSSNSFSYRNTGGDFTLLVAIEQINDDTIGYRRDRLKEDGSFKKNLRATEGRRTIQAEVTLLSNRTEKEVFGPATIEAFVDYDYVDGDSLQDLSFIDEGGRRNTVLQFSLGQLEESFSARDAALKPLYRALSRKIIDVLSTCSYDERDENL